MLNSQEQERLSNRDRSTREAEQERQWKQLQAMRQQQAQMQQQVIHEHRVHGESMKITFRTFVYILFILISEYYKKYPQSSAH